MRSGETLGHIAVKFRTTVARIKKWNRLSSDAVRAGQKLKVGFRPTAARPSAVAKAAAPGNSIQLSERKQYYRVRPGDTLGRIARKHGISVSALRNLNGRKAGQVLRAGDSLVVGVQREGVSWVNTTQNTRVRIPYGYSVARPAKQSLYGAGFRLDLYAQRFAQGHAMYLEFVPDEKKDAQFPTNFTASFADETIPLNKTSFGYNAIAAISAFIKPGRHPLVLTAATGTQVRSYTYQIQIADTRYTSHTNRVYLGDYDKPRPEVDPEVARQREERAEKIRQLIMASTAKKTQVFRLRTANQFGNELAHPRSLHKITSPYNTKRVTIRYYKKDGKRHTEKPTSIYHHGLDLRGRWGDPIYAVADGTIVCARLMHYEGNFAMIDHGNGIFTGYMHLSKFEVREGDRVKAGQLIGESGATGRARGAHLHLNLWIRGTPVDPLSLLSLPVRQ